MAIGKRGSSLTDGHPCDPVPDVVLDLARDGVSDVVCATGAKGTAHTRDDVGLGVVSDQEKDHVESSGLDGVQTEVRDELLDEREPDFVASVLATKTH